MKFSAHPVKTGQARPGLPGNVDTITGSAFTPVLESVAALPAYPAKAGRGIQATCPQNPPKDGERP